MTRVFISYSNQDESYREELEKHLSGLRRNGYIDTWADRKIVADEVRKESVKDALLNARIILFMISSDFLASDYCDDAEVDTALARHYRGEAIVIPILLRYCDWQHSPFAELKVLPNGGLPIEDWGDTDEAWMNVSNGIKAAIRSMNGADDENEFEASTNPVEELLTSLRRRALAATEAQDFRILQFDVKQFKLEHPTSSDIDEIERIVKNGLSYETQTTRTTKPGGRARESGKANRIVFISLIALLVLAFIAWWLFVRKSH